MLVLLVITNELFIHSASVIGGVDSIMHISTSIFWVCTLFSITISVAFIRILSVPFSTYVPEQLRLNVYEPEFESYTKSEMVPLVLKTSCQTAVPFLSIVTSAQMNSSDMIWDMFPALKSVTSNSYPPIATRSPHTSVTSLHSLSSHTATGTAINERISTIRAILIDFIHLIYVIFDVCQPEESLPAM